MKQLSCEQAKQIDMVDYLSSLNHHAQKVRSQDYWYLSPLHQERTASFKVNRKLNVWFDFGLGKGGDIIDFGTLYHNCPISDLLKKLSDFKNQPALSFHPPTVLGEAAGSSSRFAGENKETTDSKILVLAARALEAKGLLDYLEKRQIPLEIASQYCREVEFLLYGKKHTVIGFKNNTGGFELRNENFKGSSSPKDTTFIDNKTEQIAVFEGFFSFLSFCTINKKQTAPLTNCLILNSLSFLDKSRDLMEKHLRVHLLLDRDVAGKTNTQKALNWNRDKYIDRSEFYGGHKDLNDWLIHHQKSLQLSQRQGRKL
jgi:DNA primase